MKAESPIRLCRFESVNPRRVRTLVAGELWYSPPKQFNDLEDCRLHLTANLESISSPEAVKKAAEVMYESNVLPDGHLVNRHFDFLSGYFSKGLDNSRGKVFRVYSNMNQAQMLREEIIESTGVCCFFAAEPTNALMWAHYGANHTGICIEYEVDLVDGQLPQQLHEVNYTSQWPPKIDVRELLFSPASAIARVVATKRACWAHEREYRIVGLDMLDPASQGKGVSLNRPAWLSPKRLICGAHQVGDSQLNWDMETLAKRVGVPRARVELTEKGLEIRDL